VNIHDDQKQKVKLIVILVTILVGCASQTEFNMQNSAQEKYNNDSYGCEKDTKESGFYDGVIGKRDMEVFYRNCMANKGWKSSQLFKQQ
jgi:hypothetical protein